MWLHRKDIEKIKEVLDKFSDVETFELEQSGSSGIGTITTIAFAQEINGLKTTVGVEISGVENW